MKKLDAMNLEIDLYEEGNQYTFDIWQKSYEAFNDKFSQFKYLFNNEYINKIENKKITLQEKCMELLEIYKMILSNYISFYNKDKLLVSLFSIKEYITKNMTKLSNKMQFVIDERESINLLIFLVYNSDFSFKNNLLTFLDKDGLSYLPDIFTYARCYSLLSANMERLQDTQDQSISLIDMAFTTVETSSFHNFFDKFESLGFDEKIEDYIISNIGIEKQVERLGISVNSIRQKSDKYIKDLFGFGLGTLDILQKCIAQILIDSASELDKYIKNDNLVYNVFPIPKEILYKIADCQNVNHEEVDNIIKNFSIFKKEEKAIELSCFYENGENICFGICDLIQTFGMFEKFALSGAHLQYYNNKHDFVKLLHGSQHDMSKYFCFIMADILLKNGYKLPMEKFSYQGRKYISPRVEIDNIPYENKNILKNLGDCDVLFLSEAGASIICIEFKYFVPSVTYNELKNADRNKILKQIYDKKAQIQKREEVLKKNITTLINFMDGKPQDYSVRTIIVLARPNMYMFSDDIKDKIPYELITMNEFMKKAEKHNF